MNIKVTLLTGITVVAMIVFVFSGYEFFNAFNERRQLTLSKESNIAINNLLTAAKAWANERGVTNSALNAPSPANTQALERIKSYRSTADTAYMAAMEQIKDHNSSNTISLINKTQDSYSAIVKLRQKVEQELAKPQIARKPALLKYWVSSMSKLIIISQELRYTLVKEEASIDSKLGLMANLTHFSWIMGEYAGRERALIAGAIASELPFNENTLQELALYRGKVDLAWSMVQNLSYSSNEEVKKAVASVKNEFFNTFDRLRRSIYRAGINADPYPVTTQEWIDQSTTAVDTVIAMQKKAMLESEHHIDGLIVAANAKLFLNSVILLLSIAIVAFTYYAVLFRVIKPLNNMTLAMKKMADGNKAIIPSLKAKDEIGDIARALQGINDIGESALRVQIALNNTSSAVMLVNLDLDIVYTNDALINMFEQTQEDFKSVQPDFDATALYNTSVETILVNTDYAPKTFSNIKETYQETYTIAGHIFDIIATPVINPEGERLGTVIEWQDVTKTRKQEEQEDAVLKEVQHVVNACAQGDFSNRIDTDGLDGFLYQLTSGINQINDVSEKGLNEIRISMNAIAQGDLSKYISGDYAGLFDDIKQACNTTLTQLNAIINDATEAATEASLGNFSNRIDTAGKEGFMLELAEGINSINEISYKGLSEISKSVQAIAHGDLSKNIKGQYKGMFDEIKKAFNATLMQLNAIINEATEASVAAGRGDFSLRINLDGKDGFMKELASGINAINETSDKGLSEICSCVQAIAQGDLNQTINGDYKGMFDEIKQSFNTTLHQLSSIIQEATDVSQAAGQGDFTKQIATLGKSGFMLELAEGINSINETSYQGLSDVKAILTALSNGDLSQNITNDYVGMFDEIKTAVNQTIDKLGDITQEIKHAANDVSSSSKEIAAGSNDLSERTESQASLLQETAAAMEQMAATIQNNAENASQANSFASGAKEAATEGGTIVSNAVSAMDGIEKSSRKIADITNVIDEIAFQINLLALNAAVEAARAGEAGKGFEVVAAEVRKLAQRSANAAKDIEQLIQESGTEVQNGAKLVKEAGDSLGGIETSVTRLADIVAEIAAASQQQASGVTEINQAVTRMDTMTQQNSALVEENSATSQSLQDRATEMQERISFFRTDGSSENEFYDQSIRATG